MYPSGGMLAIRGIFFFSCCIHHFMLHGVCRRRHRQRQSAGRFLRLRPTHSAYYLIPHCPYAFYHLNFSRRSVAYPFVPDYNTTLRDVWFG